MKNIFGKKYSLKNKNNLKNIKIGSYFLNFKNKVSYFDILSNLIKKKIFRECLVCEKYLFDWEEYISFAQEDYHTQEHPSRIICPKFFPIFCSDWCHEEENQILRAIMLFGFSNWNMVSLLIGTKSPSECENHFFRYFAELGLKNKKKKWRIFSFNTFYVHILEKSQEFLPICNLKIEKKFSWLPQRCEFLNELEENFEEILNDFYQKKKKKIDLKLSDENFFFSKYNKKIFSREIRKQAICNENFALETIGEDSSLDDSFHIIIEKIKEKRREEKKSVYFKKQNHFLKKIKRPFFYPWIIKYNFEHEYLFAYFCTFNSFVLYHKTPKKESFLNFLFSKKNFKKVGYEKFFLEKSIITPKEKIFCFYVGLDPFHFFMYKNRVIFSKFLFSAKKCSFFLNFLPETIVFFLFFECFYIDYIKIIKN